MARTFILQFDIKDIPNETSLTAIELKDGIMKMKAVDGLTAHDILQIISRSEGKEEENEL